MLLADESVLCRGKWIVGGFLLLWGGFFGGIPAVIGILDATRRNGRIIVLHVVIIFGSFVVMVLDAPLFALLLLVILKIIMDVQAHIREHRRIADATLVAGVPGAAANP